MTIRDAINRRITERFITDNPIQVSLMRSDKVATGNGGWRKSEPVELDPQVFTLVVQGLQAPQITTEDGRIVTPTHVLVGKVDADVQAGDKFEMNRRSYEVIQVTMARQDWATRAAVLEQGHGQS